MRCVSDVWPARGSTCTRLELVDARACKDNRRDSSRPSGSDVLLSGVASPEALDQRGCSRNLPVEVLLPLLLLDLERESRAKYTLKDDGMAKSGLCVPEKLALTAGRAKKLIANMEKQEATIRPSHVCGTTSP